MTQKLLILVASGTAGVGLVVGLMRPHGRRVSREATLAERRRVARELHDGLAQELAFICMHCRKLAGPNGDGAALHLADAADQAMAEVRSLIEELMGTPDQPLHAVVSRTAERLTARSNAALKLDLDPAVELPRKSRNEVLRILSEALANGLRHGRASAFAVRLRRDGVALLQIADNGVGFDPDARENGHAGVGLTSMKERARSFGGDLRVRSQRGEGTVVEVVLP